jgi:hypothetical protein
MAEFKRKSHQLSWYDMDVPRWMGLAGTGRRGLLGSFHEEESERGGTNIFLTLHSNITNSPIIFKVEEERLISMIVYFYLQPVTKYS